GLLPAGTPFGKDGGIEVWRGPRNYKAVRQALAQAGYNGEPIVVVAPTDAQPIRALSLVGTDQLRRAGMNVDLQEIEQAASVRRRQNQAAPDKGGWNAYFGLNDRSVPNTNPYGNPMIRADGLAAFSGWPTSPACRLARRRQPRRATADLRRTADAALAGCALHSHGRILAIHHLSEGFARRAARLLFGVLGYSPRLSRISRHV